MAGTSLAGDTGTHLVVPEGTEPVQALMGTPARGTQCPNLDDIPVAFRMLTPWLGQALLGTPARGAPLF